MDDILDNNQINKIIDFYKNKSDQDVDLELSTPINNIKNNISNDKNNISNDLHEDHIIDEQEQYHDKKKITIDDNLINDIILDEKLYNNNFISYFKNKIKNKDEPYISEIIYYYLKNYFNYNNKLITIIKLLKLVIFFIVIFGCLLPRQFLPFYILLIIKLLVFFDIFENKYYLTLVLDKIGSKNNILFNENINNIKFILYIYLFISIFGIIYNNFNLYNIIYICINKLKKYNI